MKWVKSGIYRYMCAVYVIYQLRRWIFFYDNTLLRLCCWLSSTSKSTAFLKASVATQHPYEVANRLF